VFVPEEKLTECESDRSFPASVPLEMWGILNSAPPRDHNLKCI
jgi:hypothetical protein